MLCSLVLLDIINAVSPGPSPRDINPAAKFFDTSLYSDQDIESQAEYSLLAGVFNAGYSGYSSAFLSIKSKSVLPSTDAVIKFSCDFRYSCNLDNISPYKVIIKILMIYGKFL